MAEIKPPPVVMYRIQVEFEVPAVTQRYAATTLLALLNDEAGVGDRLRALTGPPADSRRPRQPWSFTDPALAHLDTDVRGTLTSIRERAAAAEAAETDIPGRRSAPILPARIAAQLRQRLSTLAGPSEEPSARVEMPGPGLG